MYIFEYLYILEYFCVDIYIYIFVICAVCKFDGLWTNRTKIKCLKDIHTFAAHLCDVPSLQGRLGLLAANALGDQLEETHDEIRPRHQGLGLKMVEMMWLMWLIWIWLAMICTYLCCVVLWWKIRLLQVPTDDWCTGPSRQQDVILWLWQRLFEFRETCCPLNSLCLMAHWQMCLLYTSVCSCGGGNIHVSHKDHKAVPSEAHQKSSSQLGKHVGLRYFIVILSRTWVQIHKYLHDQSWIHYHYGGG